MSRKFPSPPGPEAIEGLGELGLLIAGKFAPQAFDGTFVEILGLIDQLLENLVRQFFSPNRSYLSLKFS